MGEQQAVFQRELDEGAAQAQARETALRSQWEAEKRELQALVEKEGEEYRRVIADLRGSLAAKDAEMKQAAQRAAALEAKTQEQEQAMQTLQRALALVQTSTTVPAEAKEVTEATPETTEATSEAPAVRETTQIPVELLEKAKEQEKEEAE